MRSKPNPEIIDWALRRCGKTVDDLVSISKQAPLWLTGDAVPTTKQIQKVAKKTHVLLPYFYDEKIPDLGLRIPDFRTMSSHAPRDPSPELYDTIDIMESRQAWLSGYLEEDGADKVGFLGSCNTAHTAECAGKIRSLTGLGEGWAKSLSSEAAVRALRDAIEATGVYAFAGSYVGNSTSRAYDVEEFRGFVLADEYAPLIFLNTKDSKTAQLFTLAHEFAHLLFGESGLDDAQPDGSDESRCDKIAAEFLVPASLVYRVFDQMGNDKAIAELMRATKVSEIVCLRRARDLRLISEDEFFRRLDRYKERLAEIPLGRAEQERSSDLSFYTLQKNHLGKLFPETVYAALKSERLLYSEAYRLTGMKAKSFSDFYGRDGLLV